MKSIVFIKKIDDYNEIASFKNLLLLKKTIYYIKYCLNIVTKRKINGFNIWILPFKQNININKIEKIINKNIIRKGIIENVKIVISLDLKSKEIIDLMNKHNIEYINSNIAKKILLFNLLYYINKIQNKKLKEREITILANKKNEINIDIISKLAFECKSIKIVTNHINAFKNLEEKLYNENGIGIQFSNSHEKSLKKSDIIINLDFNEVEINEYKINSYAIIINTEDKLKIKSKLFNGIVINSYKIKFKDNLKEVINKTKLFSEFEKLDIYEAIIFNYNEYKLHDNNIRVLKTIGCNGIILEKEFKNIVQKS